MRFPEFHEKWDVRSLDQLMTKIGDGLHSTPVYDDLGEYFFINGNNLVDGRIVITESTKRVNRTEYNKYKIDLNDKSILLSINGTIGNLALYNRERVVLGKSACYLNVGSATDRIFVFNLLQTAGVKNRFFSELTGSTIKNLSLSTIRNCPVHIPMLPEQQQIAAFLLAVDEKIRQLLNKKELLLKYKKGVMRQIFDQKIHFKDDNGNDFPDWRTVSLGEVLDYEQPTPYLVSDTDYSNDYLTPVLTAGKSFVLGYTSETHGIFEKDLPVIIFDDFTTASKFVDFPFKAKSSAMKILKPRPGTNLRFIFEAMRHLRFAVGGHERHWISKFSDLTIDLPEYEEQQKIATFITVLDKKIALVNRQRERTKKFKEGLLQQMFV